MKIANRLTEISEQERRAEDAVVEGLGDLRRLKKTLAAIKAKRAELRQEQSRAEVANARERVVRAARNLSGFIEEIAHGPYREFWSKSDRCSSDRPAVRIMTQNIFKLWTTCG